MVARDNPARHLEVHRSPRDLLALVTQNVRERLRLADEGSGLVVELERVVEAVTRPIDASDGTLPAEPPERLDTAIIDLVIAEVLASPAAEQSVDAAFTLLQWLHDLRRRHADAAGPASRGDRRVDGDGGLRAAFGGPDAFQLLVEVAHDFRSPLTSILFLAETLRDGHSGPINETQKSQLGLLYSAGFGLASIASDIMDLARQERTLIDPHPEPFAFAEVVESVERLVRPIVEEKSLELRKLLPPRGRAIGHPHAVARILLNLTTNALKFTDEGFVEIGVTHIPKGRVRFHVRDTGRGIPEERRPELFHAFKRRIGQETGSRARFFSGSGVGLAIAQRLAQAMGTQIEFESSDASGTRFWFDLATEPR